MRPFLILVFSGLLAIPALAQDSKTNAPTEIPKAAPESSGLSFPVSAGVITAPFVLTNGYLYQPDTRAELGEGGKAVYDVTIPNAGEYVIHAVVDAPAEDSNSFFLNFDKPPEDPLMIWDVDVTNGFEERVVSWRGDGADGSDQFVPQKFKLSAGKHQLLIWGREPDTKLKSVSIRPAVEKK